SMPTTTARRRHHLARPRGRYSSPAVSRATTRLLPCRSTAMPGRRTGPCRTPRTSGSMPPPTPASTTPARTIAHGRAGMENPDGHAEADAGAGLGSDPSRLPHRRPWTSWRRVWAATRPRFSHRHPRISRGAPLTTGRRQPADPRTGPPARQRATRPRGPRRTAPPPSRWPIPWFPSSRMRMWKRLG
uniref:Uncharacterized protein n=1 Tax=Aegilops tauschii subsp. strangulata TaxID=200361 RepID=A0A453EIE7_AEGTS